MLFMRKKVDASSYWLFGKYTYQLGLLCGKPSISSTTCYSSCFFFPLAIILLSSTLRSHSKPTLKLGLSAICHFAYIYYVPNE